MYPVQSNLSTISSRILGLLRSIAFALFSHVLISSVFFSTATNAFAASAEDLTFSLINDDTEYAVTGFGPETTGTLVIPSTYNGKPVTKIGLEAFSNCYDLLHVEIPEGVTVIDHLAFYQCYDLISVSIPEGVTSIGAKAFQSCINLTDMTIPSSVRTIGYNAFIACEKLESVVIPEGVDSILFSTFRLCYALKSVTLPSTLRFIGSEAFDECYALSSITIPAGVTLMQDEVFEGCSSLASVTFRGPVPNIWENAFKGIDSNAVFFIKSKYYDPNSLPSGISPNAVVLYEDPILEMSMDAQSQSLEFVLNDERIDESVVFEYREGMLGSWLPVASDAYEKSVDSQTGAVTISMQMESNADQDEGGGASLNRFYRVRQMLSPE